MDKKLSSNMEDYLEAILSASKEKGYAQVKDIQKALDVKMPSVSGALQNLKEQKFIKHEKYGHIFLTRKGKKVAEEILERHTALVKFLTDILLVDKNLAEQDACKMEHILSKQTFERVLELTKFSQKPYPSTDEKKNWIKNFHRQINDNSREKKS